MAWEDLEGEIADLLSGLVVPELAVGDRPGLAPRTMHVPEGSRGGMRLGELLDQLPTVCARERCQNLLHRGPMAVHRRFCSDLCRWEDHDELAEARRRAERLAARPSHCARPGGCSNLLKTTPNPVEFCSGACKDAAKRRRKALRSGDTHGYKAWELEIRAERAAKRTKKKAA
jgi:hypothetical protein